MTFNKFGDTGAWIHVPTPEDSTFTVVLIDDAVNDIANNAESGPNIAGDRQFLEYAITQILIQCPSWRIVIGTFQREYQYYDKLITALNWQQCAFCVDLLSGDGHTEAQGKDFVTYVVQDKGVATRHIGLLTKAKQDQLDGLFSKEHQMTYLPKMFVDFTGQTTADTDFWGHAVGPVITFCAEVFNDPYAKASVVWQQAAGYASDNVFPAADIRIPHDVFDSAMGAPGWLTKVTNEDLYEDPDALALLAKFIDKEFLESMSPCARLCALKGISKGRLSLRFITELFGCSADECARVGLLGQATLSTDFTVEVMSAACVGICTLRKPTTEIAAQGTEWKVAIECEDGSFTLTGSLETVSYEAAKGAANELSMDAKTHRELSGRQGRQGVANRAVNAIKGIAPIEFVAKSTTLTLCIKLPQATTSIS